jgi:hypothetical protein
VNKTKATFKQAFKQVLQRIDELERQSLSIIVENTNAKFETEYANIKQLEMHISQYESLLQPNSSAVERARLVKQILTLPVAHKCEPIEKSVQQCMTAAADVMKKLTVSLTVSPIPISLYFLLLLILLNHTKLLQIITWVFLIQIHANGVSITLCVLRKHNCLSNHQSTYILYL